MLTFAPTPADPEMYLPPAPADRSMKDDVNKIAHKHDLSERSDSDIRTRLDDVIAFLQAQGFVFEPWQVAAFVTAVRTKPFVILAGISGTGKTKLPRLVAQATMSECCTVPVRPNWTDSSELLGFERLDGTFRPGSLLEFADKAQKEPEKQFFFVLDEMNIARVEYYLAEVLSHIEERKPTGNGRHISDPLVPSAKGTDKGIIWSDVRWPENLCIVGSVNMDDTTFGFSRKVLDRAFVIEFSTIDLSVIGNVDTTVESAVWTADDWRPLATTLASHPGRTSPSVQQIIDTLTRVNTILEQAQLQFGYRVRDEIVMFCLAAQHSIDSFTTSDLGAMDPLDLAISMKVLTRIQGGGATIRSVLEQLTSWASPARETGNDGLSAVEDRTSFPFCSAKISLMLRRLNESGFTNYWF